MFIVGDTVKISSSFVEQIKPQAITPRQKQSLQILTYLIGAESIVAALGTITASDGVVLNHIQLIPPKGHLLYHNGDGVHMYFESGTDVQESAHKGTQYGGGYEPTPNELHWQKFVLPHTALQAAATVNSITLLDLYPKGIIHAVKLQHTAAFGGGSLSAYTLSVGVSGGLTKYLGASDIFAAPGSAYVNNTIGTESQTVTTPILLTATATGANLDASTSGAVSIWLLVSLPI